MNQGFLIIFCITIMTVLSFVVGFAWGTLRTDRKFDKYLAVFDKEILGYISRDPKELLAEQRNEKEADVVDFLKYRALKEMQEPEDGEY